MEVEIRPEPEPEERAAILKALERFLHAERVPAAYRSAWREAGVRENVDDGAASETDGA